MIRRGRQFVGFRRDRAFAWPLALAAVALLAVAGQLYATRYGPGLMGDSVWYIAGARNLLAGQGYARLTGDGNPVPITAFPPLYSAALAAVAWISGLDPIEGARYLNAVLFPLNALLVAWLLRRTTGSASLAVLGALVFVTGWTFLNLHMLVMAEGLFYLLVMLSLAVLHRATTEISPRWSALAGLLASAATLTRFAGAALMPVGVAGLAALSAGEVRRRLGKAVVFLVAYAVPLGGWLVRNARLGRSATGRAVRFHLTRADVVLNLEIVARWLVPVEMVRRTRILLLLALLGVMGLLTAYLILRAYRRHGRGDERVWWLLLLAGFVGAYLAMFWASAALLDNTMRVTTRYMSPVFISLILFVPALVVVSPVRRPVRRLAVGLTAGTGLLLLLLTVPVSYQRASAPGRYLGYMAARAWDLSDAIKVIETLDPSTAIITDEIEKVYVLTGRPAYMVPIWYNTYQDRPREDFPHQMERMRQRLREGAVLVLFSRFDVKQSFLPDRATLTEGLVLVFDGRDGDVYVDPVAWAGRALPWGGQVPEG